MRVQPKVLVLLLGLLITVRMVDLRNWAGWIYELPVDVVLHVDCGGECFVQYIMQMHRSEAVKLLGVLRPS